MDNLLRPHGVALVWDLGMIQIATGFPRMGSNSLYRFFEHACISSHHEPFAYCGDCDNWLNRPRIREYDLDGEPPPSAAEFVELWPSNTKHFKTDTFFIADWNYSQILYAMQQAYPEIQWLIILRDPESQINSLRNYRKYPKVRHILMKWLELWSFIIEQLHRMEPRPKYLEFEKMVEGYYDRRLLNHFPIEDKDLYVQAGQYTWKYKHNGGGEYVNQSIEPFGKVCQAMMNTVREMCEEL